jgi:hypothetical protein
MGQVYITVVAVVFLIDIGWGSVDARLDKHVRTGILKGNEWQPNAASVCVEAANT